MCSASAYGLETVALRYLNVYGPRQALANPYTGVAAIFAARLLDGRRPLVFEDGRQIRDLVHVSDVVRATQAAMDAPARPGNAINVATGQRVRIAELAGELARALGSDLAPEIDRRSPRGRHPPLLRRRHPRPRAARLPRAADARGGAARTRRLGQQASR